MKLEELVLIRSEKKCELCKSGEGIMVYEVPPQSGSNEENCIVICNKCQLQIDKKEELKSAHWSCLTESM